MNTTTRVPRPRRWVLAGIQFREVDRTAGLFPPPRKTSSGKNGPLRRNHARIDAGPIEAAEDARVLDLHATVHHDLEAGGGRASRGVVVDNAKLHPQYLGADCNGVLGDGRDVGRLAKAVDDVDRFGYRAQVGIALLAEHLGVPGVDGD